MSLGVYFAMTWIAGGPGGLVVLVNFGASLRALVAAGDLWRLVTSTFLHGGIVHVALSIYALVFLGRNLEAFYGPWAFLSLYVLSGFGGAVASAMLTHSLAFGASPALFGLLAASILFCRRHHAILPPRLIGTVVTALLPWLVLQFIPGWGVPRVDLAAYAGGFATGGLVARFVRPDALVEAAGLFPRPPRLLLSFALSLLTVSFGSAGANIFRMRGERGPLLDPRIVVALAQANRTEALVAIDEAMEASPEDASLLLSRAAVRQLGGEWAKAIADYREVIERQPDDYRALNNLAWLLLEEADREYRDAAEATALAKRAVEIAPDDPFAAGTYGTCLLRGGDAEGAREYLSRALSTPRSAAEESTDRYLLAIALAGLGRGQEARETLRQAEQQDPDSDYRAEAESAVARSTQNEPAS
ncbi:rhomboid family intramembrane serine protease [bacterium]|nr:rhomboid family intramembrane serine protease [bacterium]